MEIDKGIPLASGLGGSAASAVAAVVAANALLPEPMTRIELLKMAMEGEAVASGSRHADNISPSLYGGLVLTVGIDHPRVKQIPVPDSIHAVIVHPHLQVSTKQARAILSRTVNLSDFVWQTANLAGFISGCYTNDLDLIKASLEDVVIEKQRQVLIPGFNEVRAAAMEHARPGLFDLRRRPDHVRAVPRGAMRPPCAMPWSGVCQTEHRDRSLERRGAVRWRARGEQRMRYSSTRGQAPQVTFSQALVQGLAPDGGLYVPGNWPQSGAAFQSGGTATPDESLPALAAQVISGFAEGDALAGIAGRHRARRIQFSGAAASRWAAAARCASWSCSTDPPRRSRISVRASWLPA